MYFVLFSLIYSSIRAIINLIDCNVFFQLIHIVTDETSQELMSVFESEKSRGGVGGLALYADLPSTVTNEYAYQKRVEAVLADQNCFKFILVRFLPKYLSIFITTKFSSHS